MSSGYLTRLRTVVQHGVQRSIIGQEGGLCSEVLIGQGKFQLCNYRLFHSFRFSSLADLYVLLQPGTIFAARSDLLLANRKRNLSVVGAISRSFSVPSVSGPSFQVCGYHIDLALSDPDHLSVSSNFRNNSMASSASKAISGELLVDFLTSKCKHLPLSPNNAGISYSIKSVDSYRRASMSLKKNEQSNNNSIHGYFLYNVAKQWCHFCPNIEAGLRGFHSSSATCSSAGIAPNVSFDNSSRVEQLASSSASSEQYVIQFCLIYLNFLIMFEE